MKKALGFTMGFMVMAALVASALWAGPGGMGKGFGPGAAVWNELSKDQQTQINTLRIEFMKKANAIKSQIGQKRIELAELANTPKPDEAAIQKKREEIWALRDAMVKERRALGTQVRSVLTPEQREKLGAMGFMGGGFGMGPGGMQGPHRGRCLMGGNF